MLCIIIIMYKGTEEGAEKVDLHNLVLILKE